MIRTLAPLLCALALAGCASPQRPRDPLADRLRPIAQPGQIVATEIAFARAAQEQGQWTAFRDYAADSAVMFVPQVTAAQTWLKDRANPPQAVRWQVHELWSSCDGSLSVTTGAWQRPDGSVGRFATVWRRDESGYRWLFDIGGALAQPLAAPETIGSHLAHCDAPKPGASWAAERGATPPQVTVVTSGDGFANFHAEAGDGSLIVDAAGDASGAAVLTGRLLQGDEFEDGFAFDFASNDASPVAAPGS